MKSDHSLTTFYYESPILKSAPAVTFIIVVLYIFLGKLSFLIPKDSLVVCPLFLATGFVLATTLIIASSMTYIIYYPCNKQHFQT